MPHLNSDLEVEIRQITNEMLSVGFQRLSEEAILSIVRRAYTAGAAKRDSELREKVKGMKRKPTKHDRCVLDDCWCYDHQEIMKDADCPNGATDYNEGLNEIIALLTSPTTEKTSNLENV